MRMTKADEDFMNKVMKIIEDNIGEDDFNVETMADILCMSHSSLLRKIRSVFNMSPVELIRTVKLKKAAELIQEGKHLIGDICYMVGIASPSYFSKLFSSSSASARRTLRSNVVKGNRKLGAKRPDSG